MLRPRGRRLRIERSSLVGRRWQVFAPVATWLAEGRNGAHFDVSNLVHFDGDYHFLSALRYLADDIGATYRTAIQHLSLDAATGATSVHTVYRYAATGRAAAYRRTSDRAAS